MFCVVCILPPLTCVDVQYFSYKLPAGGGKRSWNFRSNKMPQVRTARSCCVAARGSLSLSTVYSSIADRLLQGIELSPAAHYPPYLVIIPLFPCAPDSVLGRDKGQQLVAASHLGSFCASAKLNAKKNTHTCRTGTGGESRTEQSTST